MKILNMERNEDDGFDFAGLIGKGELKELAGSTEELCVFATEEVNRPAHVLNDHDEARYVKIPGWVRNVSNVSFATIKYKGDTYIIYKAGTGKKDWKRW